MGTDKPIPSGQPPVSEPRSLTETSLPAPDYAREQAKHLIQQFGIQVGPAPDALLAKIEPEHITKLLDSAEKESQREDSRRKQFFWGGTAISSVGVLALCWMFLYFEKPDLLKDTLTIFITAISAFAGGFGVGRVTRKDA